MQASEFVSKAHDGVVDLPQEHQNWNGKDVRVILLEAERSDANRRPLLCLRQPPFPRTTTGSTAMPPTSGKTVLDTILRALVLAPTQRLVQALKKRGVSAKVLDEALHDLAAKWLSLLCPAKTTRYLTSSNGLITATPVGTKCFTFRVTTVKPYVSAVAEINRSTPSWPSVADSFPHSRAAFADTGST